MLPQLSWILNNVWRLSYWETMWGIMGKPRTTQHQHTSSSMISRRFFWLDNETLSISWGRNWNCLCVKVFCAKRMWSMLWSNHQHQHNARLLPLTASRVIDLPLKLDSVRLFLISMDNGLCDFCSHNVVGTYAHFCVEVPPLYNSTKDKFQSLFENVVC